MFVLCFEHNISTDLLGSRKEWKKPSPKLPHFAYSMVTALK